MAFVMSNDQLQPALMEDDTMELSSDAGNHHDNDEIDIDIEIDGVDNKNTIDEPMDDDHTVETLDDDMQDDPNYQDFPEENMRDAIDDADEELEDAGVVYGTEHDPHEPGVSTTRADAIPLETRTEELDPIHVSEGNVPAEASASLHRTESTSIGTVVTSTEKIHMEEGKGDEQPLQRYIEESTAEDEGDSASQNVQRKNTTDTLHATTTDSLPEDAITENLSGGPQHSYDEPQQSHVHGDSLENGDTTFQSDALEEEEEQHASQDPQPHEAGFVELEIHPITLIWGNSEMSLFHSTLFDQYLIDDSTVAQLPLTHLFSQCRQVLSDSIDDNIALELRFSQLDLYLREDSLHAATCSLVDIIDIYVNLSLNEGLEQPAPLRVELEQNVTFSSRITQLREEATSGRGLPKTLITAIEDEEEVEDEPEGVEQVSANAGNGGDTPDDLAQTADLPVNVTSSPGAANSQRASRDHATVGLPSTVPGQLGTDENLESVSLEEHQREEGSRASSSATFPRHEPEHSSWSMVLDEGSQRDDTVDGGNDAVDGENDEQAQEYYEEDQLDDDEQDQEDENLKAEVEDSDPKISDHRNTKDNAKNQITEEDDFQLNILETGDSVPEGNILLEEANASAYTRTDSEETSTIGDPDDMEDKTNDSTHESVNLPDETIGQSTDLDGNASGDSSRKYSREQDLTSIPTEDDEPDAVSENKENAAKTIDVGSSSTTAALTGSPHDASPSTEVGQKRSLPEEDGMDVQVNSEAKRLRPA